MESVDQLEVIDGESRPPLSITQAASLMKREANALGRLDIEGEVSGFRGPNARSGHCYFQLKDEGAALDVIIWKGTYQAGFPLEDGMEIKASGSFDVWEKSGKLSFKVASYAPSGEGILRQQIEALRKKLELEGIFSSTHKAPLPRMAERLIVITSASGAVLHDAQTTLKRRNPLVSTALIECAVQGQEAAPTIVAALEKAQTMDADAILLVRGGGSLEDLMCFNDEAVVRAIAASKLPVITGIGHEPDHTLADLAATLACATPTAAAEQAAPSLIQIQGELEVLSYNLARHLSDRLARASHTFARQQLRMEQAVRRTLDAAHNQIRIFQAASVLKDSSAFLLHQKEQCSLQADALFGAIERIVQKDQLGIQQLDGRFKNAVKQMVIHPKAQVEALTASLKALNPKGVLKRGYAIVQNVKGHTISRASSAAVGEIVGIQFQDGELKTKVESVEERQTNGHDL